MRGIGELLRDILSVEGSIDAKSGLTPRQTAQKVHQEAISWSILKLINLQLG